MNQGSERLCFVQGSDTDAFCTMIYIGLNEEFSRDSTTEIREC